MLYACVVEQLFRGSNFVSPWMRRIR